MPSWPKDLLAAGVKFPTWTQNPTVRGGSQGLSGVCHPVLLAHTFGLSLLSPLGYHQQKYMNLKLHNQQITSFSSGSQTPLYPEPGEVLGLVLWNCAFPGCCRARDGTYVDLGFALFLGIG